MPWTTEPREIKHIQPVAGSSAGAPTKDLFAGGGEMGALMRSTDWSKTGLGPVELWPQSLRTMLGVVLGSRFPMLLWWGPDLLHLYNDAYRPILRDKHPGSLAAPAAEIWAEVWDVAGPMARSVQNGGPATWTEDLQLFIKSGEMAEETYFTFSYSPVPGDDGEIGGLLNTVQETTAKVQGQREIQMLHDLAARAAETRCEDDAYRIAAEVLGANELDLPFILIYVVSQGGHEARLIAARGLDDHDGDATSTLVSLDAAARAASWPLADAARLAAEVVVGDLTTRFAPLPVGRWNGRPEQAMVLPLIREGQTAPYAFLVAGVSPHRALDDRYRRFFRATANHVANVVARARAYEAERKRAEALTEIDRAKTAFFSNVSHEFRTPLTLILGPVEDALGRPEMSIQGESLQAVHRSALRLLRLVNSLLDFARIEAGRLQLSFAPTDLPAFTADLASVFRSVIERAGLTFVIDCPPLADPVHVDPSQWEKVVLNLISNAFKFTHCGTIAVALRSFGDRIELSVRDSGIGISARELPHVFERFHRVEGAKGRSFEGTGIGLSLVQELVELHGGRVSVSSVEGQGSTFNVSIPTGTAHLPPERIVDRATAPVATHVAPYLLEASQWLASDGHSSIPLTPSVEDVRESSTPGQAGAGRERVLVADDNADMRDYLGRLLGTRWQVELAGDGEAALARARAQPPDLVVSDVMMPKLDGFGLLRALHGDRATSRIPVLLLSARTGEEAVLEGLESGADDYLVKPFSARELLARVQTHLELSRLRREAEEASRHSQGLLQAVSDNSSAVIYVKDREGRYLLVNRRFSELFHLAAGDVLGKTDHDLFPADTADAIAAMDRRVVTEGAPLTAEQVVPVDDGVRTYLSVRSPLADDAGEPRGVIGISTDITDRKQAEQALIESRQHYQALADSLPHLVWTCQPNGYCDFLSRQWVEYTGRSAEEQMGFGWAEQLHPDDREHVRAAWAQATQRGDTYDEEFRIRRADGEYRWFKTRAVPLHDASGAVVKWFGSNTDFEDYKQSEQRLRAQLDRLHLLDRLTRAIGERQDIHSILQVVVRSLEDHLPCDFCCVCLYDRTDESLTVTRVGVKSEPLASKLALPERARMALDQNGLSRCVRGDLVHEPDLARAQSPFAQRLTAGGLRTFVAAPLLVESQVFGVLIAARHEPSSFSSAECEFLRQLSEHVGLAAQQAQLYTALQQAYDDLRQTQQAVAQQERLKALGQMASGIAHDINNAISPVALYTESLLETEPRLTARARDYLSTIQRAIEDVGHTVARMREFYRQREPRLTVLPVNLGDLLPEIVNLTRARWNDMPQQRGIVIHMSTMLAPDAPAILGVESEIREALINLIFNAVDAMPAGGTLTLRTRVLNDGRPSAAGASARVAIEVCDTGCGMDAETRRRCLEPFFTTKGERGTGLGLAMVYGIVERHSGDIEIESAPGEGTTVRLTFDAVAAAATDARPEPDQPRPSRLRILLVDDDPLMLKSLRDTLERDAHVVSTANGGQAGIDMFRRAQQDGVPFMAVITDLGMPYVDGRKVAMAIKEAAPSTPVIMLTGWGQRLVDDADVPSHVDRLLNKPPKLADMRLTLAELTSSHQP